VVDTPYDVAIVGAGARWVRSGHLLGRAGSAVALLERHTDPGAYKHLCTTLIQASAEPSDPTPGLDERWARWWTPPPHRGVDPWAGHRRRRGPGLTGRRRSSTR